MEKPSLKGLSRTTKVQLIVFAILLLGYCVYDVLGMVQHVFLLTAPVVILAFMAMGVVIIYKPQIDEVLEPRMKWVKPLLCVAIVVIALYVLERAYALHLRMTLPYILLNLCILGVLFCIVFFAGQQTRGSVIFLLVVCFLFGIANYFVIQFKGQPVMPSDLFALGTAAAVSKGYVYTITDYVVAAYVAFSLGILVTLFLPKPKITGKKVAINISVSLACILAFGVWYTNTDIEEDYESWFYMFRPQISYADYGSVLCFLSLMQQIEPEVPQDYSLETVNEILDEHASSSKATSSAGDDSPSVVVVMNEGFSDLSIYEALDEVYPGLEYFESIDDAVAKGEAYVSVLGGGTCNSEFEFITGSSMANLGSGYPYMTYDLSTAANMAAQFKGMGYETTAIHPEDPTNWKRDIIYDDFGFDTFIDETSFEGAETLREFTRDKATYDVIFDTLEESDDPQFIFDVTMQNHGGFDKGGIPSNEYVDVEIDGITHPELNEYLSSVTQADEDLRYLIEGLEAMDEKVVLVFFGDHQPKVMNWLYEYLGYGEMQQLDIDQMQEFYRVPYMIWANYDINGEDPDETIELDTSLNYLAAMAVKAADLPLDPSQGFLLDLQEEMPIINANGFRDADGQWHTFDENELADQRWQYAVVQYYELFDQQGS